MNIDAQRAEMVLRNIHRQKARIVNTWCTVSISYSTQRDAECAFAIADNDGNIVHGATLEDAMQQYALAIGVSA